MSYVKFIGTIFYPVKKVQSFSPKTYRMTVTHFSGKLLSLLMRHSCVT